ncbi:MAG: hypothetical protein JWO37_1307 [Acidimicrobiales bacterium]|nr:hypothetical protein [Acidimicrobiales bacterium]
MLSARTRNSFSSSAPSTDALLSARLDVPDDAGALYARSLEEGWGDGLPVLPPTEDAVRALVAATPYAPDDLICILPPRMGNATVEKAAVNAAMAGVEPDAFPLVIAALEAITMPEFNLSALAATTSSVFPMIIVNGPSRHRLGIDCSHGCMGGGGGRGSMTIGRAVALALRNVGGQRVGETSKSVFGQPARAGGLCFAEWEEESPWPSLAVQRGFATDDEVVTVHGGKGTHAMADIHVDDARELLELVAKSMAFPLGNKFLTPTADTGEVVLAINPVWAQRFGVAFPDVDDLRSFLLGTAWQPIELWPQGNREILERQGRVDDRGRVHLCARPEQFVTVVCGGRGSLHAVALPSWGESAIQSVAVAR